MTNRFLRQITALSLALLLATAPVLAQSNAKKEVKPLSDKDNPALVGKRDINKGQINFYSLDKEVAIGRQLSAEIDREMKLITDPAVTEFVNRVAQNIVLHSDAKVPFTIKVVDADEVNAFALPGGFLYVNRGLLEAADNEAEVAGVMAHEIAHVTARHGVEQASKGELFNYASIPLIFLGGIGGYAIRQAAGLAIPLGFLKFSRGAEKEADRLGAQYMWASGYDPHALVSFFEKLQAKDKRKPGTLSKLFSTHPLTGDRITEVQKLMARFPERNEYQLSSSDFKDVKSRVLAVSAASRPIGGASNDDRRPTLKRRPQTSTDDSNASDEDTPNRPVLKQRDGSAADERATSKEAETSEAKTTERPVLKRRDGSAANEEVKPAETPAETSERPVLKRKSETEKPE